MPKHYISIHNFSRDEIIELIKSAKTIKNNPNAYQNKLNNKIIATLFFEPSTRTRLSFESACLRLGARVLGFSDANTTSTKKGETLEDTIKIVSGFADCIVMRHPETGASARATAVATVPIINAGDGSGEHPTQALLDIFTISEHKNSKFEIRNSKQIQNSNNQNSKQEDNLKIAFVGDLKFGRTVHSLSQALAHFNPAFYFISPPSLKMPPEIIDQLLQKGVEIYEAENWDQIADKVNILYMTRMQAERFTDTQEYEHLKLRYILNKQTAALFRPDCLFMHPLPRVGEIDPALDADPRSIYFQEAHNGVWMRMSLLLRVFDRDM